jgi:hypothetical protein
MPLANGVIQFRKIDDTNRGDHYHLTPADECYFLFEYTSGKNFQFSQTNQLISNLKKKPSRAGRPDYSYKLRDMRNCATWLAGAINKAWLNGGVLVPIPPSKAVGHPDYDDRMSQICRAIPAGVPVDVREIVTQKTSIEAAHESGTRPTVAEMIDLYQINEALAAAPLQRIAIVDDVLTAGVHWRAMHHVLSQRFPGVPIVGMFIARRVFPPDYLTAGFEPVL